MRGSDLRGYSVQNIATLPDGRAFPMCFCFETFARAEDVYVDVFHRDADIIDIIGDLSDGSDSALLALAYGAAAIKNESLTLQAFFSAINTEKDKYPLMQAVVDGLSRMFRDASGGLDGQADDSDDGFPWDIYYKAALALGMSDAEFWAATPRKIWLLTRDKENEERQVWLTQNYV